MCKHNCGNVFKGMERNGEDEILKQIKEIEMGEIRIKAKGTVKMEMGGEMQNVMYDFGRVILFEPFELSIFSFQI